MPEPVQEIQDSKQEGEDEIKKSRTALFLYSILPKHKIFLYKTSFDRSEYPIILNILVYTFKSFIGGYGPSAAINVLYTLKKFGEFKKNPKVLVDALFNMKNLRMGAFMATNTFILKSMIALLRITRKKDDGLTAAISGFVAGWTSLFFLDGKKAFLASFMLSRGMESIYNSKADKGEIKKKGWHSALMFVLLSTTLAFCWMHEHHLLSPELKKYIDGLGKMAWTNEDMNFMYFAAEHVRHNNMRKANLLN